MAEHSPHKWQTLKSGVSHIGIICSRCGLFYLAKGVALHLCDSPLSPWERTVVLTQETAERLLEGGILDEERAKRILSGDEAETVGE